MSRRWAVKLTLAYFVILFWLTLGGFYHPGATRNLVPFRMMQHDIHEGGWEFLVNFVGNVVVTLPVGWIMAFFLERRCSVLRVGFASMGLSTLIEVIQGFSGRRVADVDDVILNTLGGVLGYCLWMGVARWTSRSRNASRVSTDPRLPTGP